jgi:CO/xanthine dehydrogenase Mo-binding subunit
MAVRTTDHTQYGFELILPCSYVMSLLKWRYGDGEGDAAQVVNATDVGQIIDPHGLEGQLNGCLGSAGIDSAIFEETVLDRRTGHIMNPNLIDYKWRTFAELPVLDHVVLETPFPSHRFRAVGVGEVATSPGPSAVLMAASNAVGTWLCNAVTPQRIPKAREDRRCDRRCQIKPFVHHNAKSIEAAGLSKYGAADERSNDHSQNRLPSSILGP